MKKPFVAALLIVMGVQAWQNYGPRLSALPKKKSEYVVVYGRDGCSYTSRMRAALSERGVPFEYRVVDDPEIADILHSRMRLADMNTRHYLLPVVEISGALLVRPAPAEVSARYLR